MYTGCGAAGGAGDVRAQGTTESVINYAALTT